MLEHGFMFDWGRQIERAEIIDAELRRLAAAGYTTCLINVEDSVEFPSAPGIGRKYAYTPETLGKLAATAGECKLEFIPVIPSLGHARYITTKTGYRQYDEGFASGECLGCLQVGSELTIELLERLYRDWCAIAPGRYLHIGMDECPAMGQALLRSGKVEKLDHAKLFSDHCNRLNGIVKSLGRRMIIWGDMLYYFPEALEQLDKDIIVMDWYYYSFDDTPRVEIFNFEKIDLTAALRDAGFTVWLTPSVWPNLPFGDVADRLGNLRSWVRYGNERGIDAVVVNTDWSNHAGTPDMTELLWLTFIRLAPDFGEAGLRGALAAALAEDFAVAPREELIDLLLELGRFHVTGTNNYRCTMCRTAPALITTDPVRRAEADEKSSRLSELLEVINRQSAGGEIGQRLLAGLKAAIRLLHGYWLAMAELSRLSAERRGAEPTAAALDALAAELSSTQREFTATSDRVRYPGDFMQEIQFWAGRIAGELAEESRRLRATLGAELFDNQMRLEFTARVPHPSMSALSLSLQLPDGREIGSHDYMVKFESVCSNPDQEFYHYSTLPLDIPEVPVKITATVRDYGEVEIQTLKVIRGDGSEVGYRAVEYSGRHAGIDEKGFPLLGPRRAQPDDPTHRLECDCAIFLPSVN